MSAGTCHCCSLVAVHAAAVVVAAAVEVTIVVAAALVVEVLFLKDFDFLFDGFGFRSLGWWK